MASRFHEPPEKRRKTDALSDDLWDDDNELFSQAVLDDIDHIVQSQQVYTERKEANNNSSLQKHSSAGGYARSGTLSSDITHGQSLKSQGYHTLPNGQSSAQSSVLGTSKGAALRSQNMVVKSGHSTATLRSCQPPQPSQSVQPANSTSQLPGGSGNQFTHVMKQKLKTLEEENIFFKNEVRVSSPFDFF